MLGYLAGNPVWGTILDRVGIRVGMLLAVAIWTLASALHALLFTVAGFAVARLVLGFGEGATFPGALRTCVQTLEPDSRGRGIALSYSGGSLGAIITPFVVTPIFVAYGWRAAFWFTGLIGALWLLWWWIVSARPDIRSLPERVDHGRIRWSDRRLWAFILLYALGNVPLSLVVNMGALFLARRFHLTQVELRDLLWIPPLGWELGYFFWGTLLDRRLRAAGSHRIKAYPRVFLLGLAVSAPFALVFLAPSLAVTMALLFTTMFATGAFIIPAVSYATHVLGERQSALIGGIGAGSFAAASFAMGPAFGWLLDQKAYNVVFPLAAGCPVLGVLLWTRLARPESAGTPIAPSASAH
jgi:ACS family hexuronate transporter-like MFS transporter